MVAPLRFDPVEKLLVSRRLFELPAWSAPALGACLLGMTTAISAFEGLLAKGSWSMSSDLAQMLGATRKGYQPSAEMPLERDIPTLVLVFLSALSMGVAARQGKVIASCLPALIDSKVVKWRRTPAPQGFPASRVVSRLRQQHPSLTCRRLFEIYAGERLEKIRSREFVALAGAAVLAATLQYLANRPEAYLARQPPGLEAGTRYANAVATQDNWWASYGHVAGATWYAIVAFLAIFTILVHNIIAAASASALLIVPSLAALDCDWLNSDGAFGWQPLRRVYRLAYVSLAVRGLGIAALILALNLTDTLIDVAIAGVWGVFILFYVALPYLTMSRHLADVKMHRVHQLKLAALREMHQAGADKLAITERYAARIREVRESQVDAVGLPRLESSGLTVVVLLPIILTVLQIVL